MDSRTTTRAPERALPPGTLLQRFEIVRVLAETPSGIDYFATDLQRDSDVLIKEYFPARLAHRVQSTMVPRAPEDTEPLARGLQAFLAEANLLARIDHPALVHVSTVIESHGTAYQVQPHRGGVSLLDVRKEMRQPPNEHSVRVLIDGLLGALQALHDEGVVHGGITPGNVLLLANDHPLLLSPDLAHAESKNELIESLMASVEPAFGAPEQRMPAPNKPLGPWTDIYGVAATMRYFISAELPPPVHEWPPEGAHEPMADMVQRICTAPDAPRYSTALLNALDAALGHVPGARPRSVAAFRGALGALAKRESRRTHAAPPPAPQAAAKPAAPAGGAASAASAASSASAPPSSSMLGPQSFPPSFDSDPGMVASRFIEPDPEPDMADIDRIVTHGAMRASDRHQPFMPRGNARWIGATFVLALACAGFGGWWAMRDAPLNMPPTSAGPTATEPRVDADPAPAATPPATRVDHPSADTAPAATSSPPPVSASPSPSMSTPLPSQDIAPAQPPTAAAPQPLSETTPAPTVSPAPQRAPSNLAKTPPAESRAAPPPAARVTVPPLAPTVANPREACAGRTQFALYRCMQTQCATAKWEEHPQCIRLRATDSVD